MNEPRNRKSLLTTILTRAAGLAALVTGAATLATGCDPMVAKYGGPPEDYCYEEADGGGCEEDAGVEPQDGDQELPDAGS